MHDYLIIGQGLAGSTLFHYLHREGADVAIADRDHFQASSMVAAGLYNPVVFKRLNMSWRGMESYDEAIPFYRSVDERLIHEREYTKVFGNEHEAEVWQERHQREEFRRILGYGDIPENSGIRKDEHGVGSVQGTGYLDIPQYLTITKEIAAEVGRYHHLDVDFETIQLEDQSVLVGGIKAKTVVFAEGFAALKNPYFQFLPLRHNQGEVLLIKAPELASEKVLSRGIFVLPLGNGLFRVGSTYNWKSDRPETTEKGLEFLTTQLERIISCPYEILEHKAGVRPTVKDRRPLCGRHPKHPQLAIFNGLGTRGVLIAPLLAKEMTQHLIQGEPLHPEADLDRFVEK